MRRHNEGHEQLARDYLPTAKCSLICNYSSFNYHVFILHIQEI